MPEYSQAADFVTDPSTPLDDLANSVHASAFDLVKQVLEGLGEQGNISPAAPGFLAQYAAAAGLGLVVMAFSAIFAVVHGMRSGGRDDLRESLFKYLPLAVFLITFSPAIGVLVTNVANAATSGIVDWGATTIGQTGSRVDALAGITADKLPGGTFVGLIVSVLIVAGALGVFLVLAVEKIGLPVAGILAGIGWGMLVHPVWRLKALRVPTLWVSLVFVKPFLFLLLAAAFGAFGSAEEASSGVSGLIQLCLLAVTLGLSSVVPLMVVRRFPLAGNGSSARSAGSSSAPVGVRGPAVASQERVTLVPASFLDQNSLQRGQSHTIRQAYERGQQDREKPQRDRGQPQRRPGTQKPSHIAEDTRTESISPPRLGRV
jgi:hypothetical protein